MDNQKIYTIGHHPKEDSADYPIRYVAIVALDSEMAIKKFREKYPNTRIEEDLKCVFDTRIEEIV